MAEAAMEECLASAVTTQPRVAELLLAAVAAEVKRLAPATAGVIAPARRTLAAVGLPAREMWPVEAAPAKPVVAVAAQAASEVLRRAAADEAEMAQALGFAQVAVFVPSAVQGAVAVEQGVRGVPAVVEAAVSACLPFPLSYARSASEVQQFSRFEIGSAVLFRRMLNGRR